MNPVISLKNVSKVYGRFSKSKTAINNISFDVFPGKIIGYIGPNGAGKSTTIKILTGAIGDFTGDVNILGMDIRNDAVNIKKRIGYIPENASLYEVLTPLEYLQFIGQLYSMEVDLISEKAQKLLQLFELNQVSKQRISTFSKGMKQKVLLISGLIHNPDIIFLDEPLSGLDANSVIMVKEVLRQLALEGKTIFYSSHLMDVVEKISDRIMLIANGEIIADGTFDELSKGNENQSLEALFSQLTGVNDQTSRAGEFIKELHNNGSN
ncbi:MAG: ABC transporter ATP-binding protein [Bacteroidetes bacterium]|nr:ABC transporter ATP-binding protein [Bacteroidota bacterium]